MAGVSVAHKPPAVLKLTVAVCCLCSRVVLHWLKPGHEVNVDHSNMARVVSRPHNLSSSLTCISCRTPTCQNQYQLPSMSSQALLRPTTRVAQFSVCPQKMQSVASHMHGKGSHDRARQAIKLFTKADRKVGPAAVSCLQCLQTVGGCELAAVPSDRRVYPGAVSWLQCLRSGR